MAQGLPRTSVGPTVRRPPATAVCKRGENRATGGSPSRRNGNHGKEDEDQSSDERTP
jgi:hypothetical protein